MTSPRDTRLQDGLRIAARQDLEEFVEVFLLPEGEIYLAPQPDGTALVSLLMEERTLSRFSAATTEAAFMETLRSCPFAFRHLEHAERITPHTEGLAAVVGRDDLVAVLAQGEREQRLNGLLVVDEEDARGVLEHGVSAQGTPSYPANFACSTRGSTAPPSSRSSSR